MGGSSTKGQKGEKGKGGGKAPKGGGPRFVATAARPKPGPTKEGNAKTKLQKFLETPVKSQHFRCRWGRRGVEGSHRATEARREGGSSTKEQKGKRGGEGRSLKMRGETCVDRGGIVILGQFRPRVRQDRGLFCSFTCMCRWSTRGASASCQWNGTKYCLNLELNSVQFSVRGRTSP